MATLSEIRQKFPQYGDMSDVDLANALHSKYYADMPRNEFDGKVGLDPYAYEAEETRKALYGDRRPAQPGDEVSRDTILPFRETMGPDGKPKTELAVPGIVMEPLRAAGRLFQPGQAPGMAPLSQMPQPIAEQKIGDAMAASSVAVPGTRVPRVTTAPELALQRAAQTDDALGPVIRGAGEGPRSPSPPMQDIARDVYPKAAAQADEAFGPAIRQDVQPSPILGGQPRDELLAAAGRLGIEVPDALASDSFFKRGLAGIISADPFGGAPIVNATRKLGDAIEGRRADLVDELGGATRAGAGQAARDGIKDWVTTGSKAEGNEIYSTVDALTDKSTAVPLTNLRSTIAEIEARAAGMRFEPPEVIKKFKEAADDPAGLTFEQLKDLRTQTGQMMEGMKIGPQAGIDDAAVKQLYGALSKDLTDLVRESGRTVAREQLGTPAGRAAIRESAGKARLTKADEARVTESAADIAATIKADADARFAKEIAAKRDELRKIIGNEADASPEEVVRRLRSYAGAKGGANIGRLQQAMGVLDADATREIRAAVIAELGNSKDGLSLARFRTELDGPNGMSPAGRQVLFGPELNQILTDIGTVGERFEQLAKLGNPSGTGRFVVYTGMASSAAGLVLTGSVAPLAAAVSLVGGTYIFARMLARPASAKVVRDFMSAGVGAVGGKRSQVEAFVEAVAKLEAAAKAVSQQEMGDEKRGRNQ